MADGDQLRLLENHFDFKEPGPEFAGDEKAVVFCVVGDAVEHGFMG
jgi:hypothetical protein